METEAQKHIGRRMALSPARGLRGRSHCCWLEVTGSHTRRNACHHRSPGEMPSSSLLWLPS